MVNDINYLVGKVKMKMSQKTVCNEVQIIRELCTIRDGTVLCDTLNRSDVCKLIESMSLN